jgi:hypothetical protein
LIGTLADPRSVTVPKTIARLSELSEPAKTSGKCQKRPDRALTKPTDETLAAEPDLAWVVDAWRGLPAYIRRAILALVETKN